MIEFLCPNGHKIRCGDERAGMAAKCPKCGVKFHIPTLTELTDGAAPAEVTEEPAPPPGGSSSSGVSDGIVAGAATDDDQIEFLCPNDHLLHGPLALQGHPGKCPECGSRFRIPSLDESEYEEQTPNEPEPMPPPAASESWKGVAENNALATAMPGSAVELGKSSIESPTLASLFPLLWSKRAGGATLEIRYGDGQRLTPDRFFPALSRGTHGVFAVEEPGASFSLLTLAWESVSSVTVRGVKKLPEGGRE